MEYNLDLLQTESITNIFYVCDYYDKMNSKRLPFFFEYITYKKGTDILTESQQYRLCCDLLEKGHSVYILNDKRVTPYVEEYLTSNFSDRVKFVDNKDNITEPYFIVNL